MTVYYSLPKVSVSPPSSSYEDSSPPLKKKFNLAPNRKVSSIVFYSCTIFALVVTILALSLVVCNSVQENCRLMNCFFPSKMKPTSNPMTKPNIINDLLSSEDSLETQIPQPPTWRENIHPKFSRVQILAKPSDAPSQLSSAVAPIKTDTSQSSSEVSRETDASQLIPPTEAPRDLAANIDVDSDSETSLMHFIVTLPLIRWFLDDYDSGELLDK